MRIILFSVNRKERTMGARALARVLLIGVLVVSSRVSYAGWELLDGELSPARNSLTGEAANGHVYAIGGHAGGATPAVSKYDPGTDSWSLVASMPTARHSLSSAVLGNYIYAVGGHVSNSRSEVERYDFTTGTWESRASLNTARSGAGVAAYDGRIYVFGGNRYGTYQSSIERYDPDTNAWSYVGNMPSAAEPWGGL